MTTSVQATPASWQTFQLTRQGQLEFWDRQAQNYDQSVMTHDNEGELNLVSALSKQYIDAGYSTEDIVTLGGAVGSRDPKVVLKVFGELGRLPSSIYFNDLSVAMTEYALKSYLTPQDCLGAVVRTMPGLLQEACETIPAMPRRVIIGVYRTEALATANPHHGFPVSGFNEYLNNAPTLGSAFLFQAITIEETSMKEQVANVVLDVTEDQVSLKRKEQVIRELVSVANVDAVRIVSRSTDRPGFFLSHWYSERGLRKLMTSTFGVVRTRNMSIMPCAKGYVVCIDPVNEEPRGIVTILNNVIGNVLPDDQYIALKAVAKMTA